MDWKKSFMKSHHLNYKELSKFFIHICLIFCSFATYLIAIYGNNEENYILSIFLLWLAGILFCFFNIYDRIFLLFFFIAFFNFLIGRSFLILIGLKKEYYFFTIEESIAGQKIVYISLASILIAYTILEKIILKKKVRINYEKLKYKIIKKISLVFFYVTYIFLFITILATVLHVLKNGYTSIYVDTGAKVPLIIKKIGDISNYMFYIFLSTMPSKKEIKIPGILFVITLVLSLGTGARFEFVIGVLTLFLYILLRNRINSHMLWIGTKKIIFLFFIGIFMMVMLSMHNVVRFGKKLDTKNTASYYLTRFIFDQGVSMNINKRIFKFKDEIPQDRFYSLDSVISFYQRNISGRILNQKYYTGASKEKALNGNSLADTLSYIVLGEKRYLEGEGLGSSYIAEIYLDFGYSGLVFYNILLAFFLLLIKYFIYNKGIFKTTLAFFLFMSLLKIPRARADAWVLEIIDPTIWISFFIVIFFYNMYLRKIKIKLERKCNKNDFSRS